MATNFDFLKPVDKNLFDIITEAEKLYRDEYFEQCMSQTRRFGEHVCKNVLGKNRTTETTFDDMLATLKDRTGGAQQEKEFIKDLYYLKKQGNTSVHSSSVKKDGITALKCLQRAFEVAISYAVYNKKAKTNILKLQYDTELLVTGKKTEQTLAEKYLKEKQKEKTFTKRKPKSTKKTKALKKQVYTMKPETREKGFPIFWTIVAISFVIALAVMVMVII